MNRIVKCKKNGRDAYRVDVIGSDGKRHQLFRATEEAAHDALAKAIIAARTPTRCRVPSDITLRDYVPLWAKLAAPKLKPKSLRNYRTTLEQHILPSLGGRRVRDIGRSDLRQLLSGKQERGYAANSVKLMLSSIRVVLASALDDEIVAANPARSLGKTLGLKARRQGEPDPVRAMERPQRDRFLSVAARIAPTFAALWNVAVRSGIRPGEAFALQPSDLDLDAATATISRTVSDNGREVGTTKTGESRTIDLSAHAVAVLRAQIAKGKSDKLRHGWAEVPSTVFYHPATGKPLRPRAGRDAFAAVVKAAGLPRTLTPHALRHTFASQALIAGIDVYYVSRMLGHASTKITVDIYGKWLNPSRPGALDVLDAPATAQS
jgi:integrase